VLPRRFLQVVQNDTSWDTLSAGLPPVPGALSLLKALLVQRWLRLTDAELIAELEDRISLRRFCGLDSEASLPSQESLASLRSALGPDVLRDLLDRWPVADEATPLLSVVSPVYRAEGIVDEFVRVVSASVRRLTENFEIVLVEDGSGDGTWSRIEAACAVDPRVKGIKLSRNFGQHKALTAGLEAARGRWTVVMDCDLQDDPAFIPDLFAKACEGHDVVLTTRTERAHGRIKNAFSRLFFNMMSYLSGDKRANWLVGGYSILSRRAVDAFRRMKDVHRHYLGLLRWLGFPPAHVPVTHRPRHSGRSSYNLLKLIRHAIDGWVSHSNRLLYAAVAVGFLFLFGAIAGSLLVVALYFLRGFAAGWPSLVVLILLSTGSVLLTLGVLGIYVGKIFDQVRARPLYVVEQTRNMEDFPS